ncbi:MAG: hypothetical protein PHN84_06970 [Desulfuromonadaceae bacterium]|nr:hypothetical protein [Desulfuromonadaceae bacterium]MDD2854177.1 hypothetical protein [Desulfuromonadaceae bacterium]
MIFRKFLLLLPLIFLLSGCTPGVVVKDFSTIDPNIERESLYIVPFDATLVPADFGEPIFNQFVDILNARRKFTKVRRFAILKEELKDVEPAWLINQTYISGDIWGYVQTSGCCSTDLKVKARIYLYEAGKSTPSFEVSVPVEHYFDHDRSDITKAKADLGKKLALDLAEAVIRKFTP